MMTPANTMSRPKIWTAVASRNRSVMVEFWFNLTQKTIKPSIPTFHYSMASDYGKADDFSPSLENQVVTAKMKNPSNRLV
jgi:hypothetical protein